MKVVLLGYMGSGKSTVGRRLAKRTKLPFIDLDDYITQKEGQSIPDLFATKGEIYFRKVETECLRKLLETKGDFILALGGGTPCYGANMDLVNAQANSVYLKGSLSYLAERLSKPKRKNKRPLIKNLPAESLHEFLAKHLFERRPYYEKAKFAVEIDERFKEELVDEICKLLALS